MLSVNSNTSYNLSETQGQSVNNSLCIPLYIIGFILGKISGGNMSNITIGQIVSSIAIITAISGFIVGILKWFNSTFLNRFENIEKRLNKIEDENSSQKKDINDSKEERLIMINGLLACLKGLHTDLNCNGPVTKGINEIESYLIKKSHE